MIKTLIAIGSVSLLVIAAAACSSSSSGGGGGTSAGGGTGDDTVDPSCMTDDTVTCTGGATGYSCTSDISPDTTDGDLDCSEPTGTGDYCCIPLTVDTDCQHDDTLDCSGNSFGFTCDGTSTPEDDDSSLVCSDDTGTGTFCCSTFTYSSSDSCKQDATVDAACGDGSYGFSCASGDTPDADDSSITCSTAVTDPDDPTLDDFCCSSL